jgi:hypothetical protein
MSVRAASSEVLGDGWALVDQCVEDPIELGVHSVGIGLVIDRVKQRLTQPHAKAGCWRWQRHAMALR